ncbi:MAG: hypothetical protein ACK4SJ_11245 [Sphingorhabdus sp.]
MTLAASTADDRRRNREATEEAFRSLPRGDLLLGYQRRTVDKLFSGVSLLALDKSRRIGLTWGVAAFATLKASASLEAGGQNIWYMGYDKDMTLEFIEVCAMWARAFNLVAGDIEEEEVLDEDSGKAIKAYSIRLASGFRITGLASVPRSLRGKQGIVIIDEAAFHSDVDEVIKAAMALLIWGGQVVVISTHDGVGNAFNQLLAKIDGGERAGERLTITFQDALADGLYERVAMVAKTKGMDIAPKEKWVADIYAAYGEDASEELDCIPKVGSGALISLEEIASCEHDDCGLPELYQGGLCYVGRDVARRRDGQIQYCMELVGDVLWQRDTYEEFGQTFAHQDAFFDALFKTRRIAAAWVDQTGMGEKVVEDAIARHGSRVHGELLTGPSRLDLAMALKKRFEERTIRIRKDAATRADLMAIKRIGSEQSGGIRIVNDGKIHADRFWAYGLACRAAELPMLTYDGFHSVGRARDRDRHSEDDAGVGRGSRLRGRGAWG